MPNNRERGPVSYSDEKFVHTKVFVLAFDFADFHRYRAGRQGINAHRLVYVDSGDKIKAVDAERVIIVDDNFHSRLDAITLERAANERVKECERLRDTKE